MTRAVRSRLVGYGLVAPLLAAVSLLLAVPLAIGLWYSFREGSIFGIETTLTLGNYEAVVKRDVFWEAVQTSVLYGLGTAFASLAVGFVIARYVRFERPRWAPMIVGAVMLSVLGGYLVRIYAWRTLLAENGVVNSTLEQTGASSDPLSLLFTPAAVILTLGSIYAPYATLLILAGLENVRDDEIEAARDLGAGWLRTYRLIVLPLIGRSLLLAFTLVFFLSAADYVIPPLVGGPSSQMVGVLISNQFLATGDTPMGAAFGFTTLALFGFVATLGWAAMKVLKLLPRERGR